MMLENETHVGQGQQQLFQFEPLQMTDTRKREVAVTEEIEFLLRSNAPVAAGVSGGKDSQAMVLALNAYLDHIGHGGPRVLIHSDLGRVEWRESSTICEKLAAHTGWEMIVVRRRAGDMLHRWQDRWRRNLVRYVNLSCVRLIMPWSSAAQRFCTSEMKESPIASDLKRRFPGTRIVSAIGIRAQESAQRAKRPLTSIDNRVSTQKVQSYKWNPILHWTREEVFAEIAASGLDLHEAYTKYGSTRVSCAFCILASGNDLRAASACSDNAEIYRLMVDLENASGFSFQSSRWLADVAPHLLDADRKNQSEVARSLAEQRIAIEARIPKHLEYVDGWPLAVPSDDECELIAGVRREIAKLYGLEAKYQDGPSVKGRYEILYIAGIVARQKKEARKAKKGSTGKDQRNRANETRAQNQG